MRPELEVAVDAPVGAAVHALGVSRLELCADLASDGLTPDDGMVRATRRAFPGTLSVMVRVKPGPFTANSAELELMLTTIANLRGLGVDALVLGLLGTDNQLDREKVARCIHAAGPVPVTFHRAFDRVADPLATAQELVALGVRSLLTSGGAPTAMLGRGTLETLVLAAAEGRAPAILAGGGIRAAEAAQLARINGLAVIHRSGLSNGSLDHQGLVDTLAAIAKHAGGKSGSSSA